MENSVVKTISRLSLFLFLFVFIYYFFYAFNSVPMLGDSSEYHIPIAKSILDGTFIHPQETYYSLTYYPGASNAILSLFLFFNIPPNLFNVFGYLLLFITCIQLGKTFGLSKDISIIYSSSIVLTLSVVRGIPTQSIDILLAVYFGWLIILLENPKKNVLYFILLGFFAGMIIGSKYSGPFYLVLLFIIYIRSLLSFVSIKNILFFLIPFSVFGLFWYVRNYYWTGNPIYPGGLFMFEPKTEFKLQKWQVYKTIYLYKNGFFLFVQSLISEYVLLTLTLILNPFLILYLTIKKKNINNHIIKLTCLGIGSFIVYLILPSWPENIISDLRYAYISFITLTLALFLFFKQFKKIELISYLSFFNMLCVMPMVPYRPKLFIFTIVVYTCINYKWLIKTFYEKKK